MFIEISLFVKEEKNHMIGKLVLSDLLDFFIEITYIVQSTTRFISLYALKGQGHKLQLNSL